LVGTTETEVKNEIPTMKTQDKSDGTAKDIRSIKERMIKNLKNDKLVFATTWEKQYIAGVKTARTKLEL